MKIKRNNHNYQIHKQKDSSWVKVTKDNKQIATVMDLCTAYQVIYQDVIADGGVCEFLSEMDFE